MKIKTTSNNMTKILNTTISYLMKQLKKYKKINRLLIIKIISITKMLCKVLF